MVSKFRKSAGFFCFHSNMIGMFYLLSIVENAQSLLVKFPILI